MSQAAADELQRRLVSFAIKLNETGIWLLIILEARMVPTVLVENLIKENRELPCILGASIRSAQAKASQINK
jgi:hypothetical protein